MSISRTNGSDSIRAAPAAVASTLTPLSHFDLWRIRVTRGVSARMYSVLTGRSASSTSMFAGKTRALLWSARGETRSWPGLPAAPLSAKNTHTAT